MDKYNDWSKVHADNGYTIHVKPVLVELGIKDCGEYTCENCIDGNS